MLCFDKNNDNFGKEIKINYSNGKCETVLFTCNVSMDRMAGYLCEKFNLLPDKVCFYVGSDRIPYVFGPKKSEIIQNNEIYVELSVY